MNEFIAFVLPVAVALAGARMGRLVLGKTFAAQFGLGVQFALGLAVGMLVFSQALFFFALEGINAAHALAWLALLWGAVELVLLAIGQGPKLKEIKPKTSHLWLLLLLPVFYTWWIFGRLSTLEGTLEFDAAAFWVFKSKVLYLTQGRELAEWYHKSNLAYAHWQYPPLVTSLYTLGYGAVGGVNEFVNKVWPFWMVVALSGAILSLGKVWQRPHPLPVLVAMLFCFLPGSLYFIRQEGGTMALAFYTSLACLLIVCALSRSESPVLAAGVLVLAGCAVTKLEGTVFAAVWFCVLLPIIWRRGWLKHPVLWKAAGAGVLCLVPYILYRLAHPMMHAADEWWKEGASAPGVMLHRFPNLWFLNVFHRFFSADFFHWSANSDGNIQWDGHWTGLGSLVNSDLAILPWLLMFLLVFSLLKKTGRSRMAIVYLSLAIIGVFTALAVVITCFLSLQAGDGAHHFGDLMTEFSGDNVGRYSYPFFTGWFLGVVSMWFPDANNSVSQPGEANKKT